MSVTGWPSRRSSPSESDPSSSSTSSNTSEAFPLTDEEWSRAMGRHLDAWLAKPRFGGTRSLLRHMKMDRHGWFLWREKGIVPKRTRRLFTIYPEDLTG